MNNNDSDKRPKILHEHEQQELTSLSRQALEKSVHALPGNITERLTAARRAAISSAIKPELRGQLTSRYVLGMAASVLLISLVWLLTSQNQINSEQLVVADEAVPKNQDIEKKPKSLPVNPSPSGTLDKANSAEDLLTAMALAQLDPESEALLEDLEFLYWLSLEDQIQDEDV